MRLLPPALALLTASGCTAGSDDYSINRIAEETTVVDLTRSSSFEFDDYLPMNEHGRLESPRFELRLPDDVSYMEITSSRTQWTWVTLSTEGWGQGAQRFKVYWQRSDGLHPHQVKDILTNYEDIGEEWERPFFTIAPGATFYLHFYAPWIRGYNPPRRHSHAKIVVKRFSDED